MLDFLFIVILWSIWICFYFLFDEMFFRFFFRQHAHLSLLQSIPWLFYLWTVQSLCFFLVYCFVLSESIHTRTHTPFISFQWLGTILLFRTFQQCSVKTVHVHRYAIAFGKLECHFSLGFSLARLLFVLIVCMCVCVCMSQTVARVQFMRMDFTCLLYFSVTHQFQNANTISNSHPRLSTLSISFSDSLCISYMCCQCLGWAAIAECISVL